MINETRARNREMNEACQELGRLRKRLRVVRRDNREEAQRLEDRQVEEVVEVLREVMQQQKKIWRLKKKR